MNQHRIILSIGSNKGNKLKNIKKCIELIHNKIATVINVSKVYETPSWGFQSDAFYNVALLVHTEKSPHEILEKILGIERELGRIRTKSDGYQSREIDIDIIAFDREIIASENLQIPHPRMQDRLFVLKPIEDLLITRGIKQGVDGRVFDFGDEEEHSGKVYKKKIKIKAGIDKENAKKIVQLIKQSKLKVQAAIMDDIVRVSGKKIDELQAVISMLRSSDLNLPLQFINMK